MGLAHHSQHERLEHREFHFKNSLTYTGRLVPYADVPGNRQTPEIKRLRGNPHRLHLGQIGFVLTKADGSAAQTNDLTDIEQTLDLWNGVLVSHFKLEGQPVEVQTICHPTRDLLAVRVVSPLLKRGRVAIQIHFPYGTGATTTADWSKPDAHETIFEQDKINVGQFTRKLDNDSYLVNAKRSADAKLTQTAKHEFLLSAAKNAGALELVCALTPKPIRGDFRVSNKRVPPRASTGISSGVMAARLTCPGAKTRAGANWSGGSCCRNI